MLWETIWNFLTTGWDAAKVWQAVGTLVTIVGGISAIRWRNKTADRRRLRLLEDFIKDREASISRLRPEILNKIDNSQYQSESLNGPDILKEVNVAVELLDAHEVTRAQDQLEKLLGTIKTKQEYLVRHSDELKRHQANVSLFLAALADRRKDAAGGLKHIGDAKRAMAGDLDVLKYEALLRLTERNFQAAKVAFSTLEDAATGTDARHYKAVGAEGRGDAHRALNEIGEAQAAYNLALTRSAQAQPEHQNPLFNGRLHMKLAQLFAATGRLDELQSASNETAQALEAFKSSSSAQARLNADEARVHLTKLGDRITRISGSSTTRTSTN